jgi:sugar transferase EpsL
LALILLAPILVAVAFAVRFKLGSPVYFTQLRPGMDGRPFTLHKFRTMSSERDRHGKLLDDAARLSPFGRWLRSTSLDELPGLWNVIRGDMSIVGPRPLLMEYLELYSPRQHRRHRVKPGITGLAQVNGRNAISWEQKFEYDVQYVETVSLWLDLVILVKSIQCVLRRSGVSAASHVTMPLFTGTEQSNHDQFTKAA